MTFAIKTLGCKVNIYESNYLREKFIENGFNEVSFKEVADVYIINTCTVTNNADHKSKQLIKRFRKQNKKAILVVTGCFVHNDIEIDADIVVKNEDKNLVLMLVQKHLNLKINDVDTEMIIKKPKQTRAFVKIQDGCENYCSYCIIPYVRGAQKSKDIQSVLNEIKGLVQNGYKEIVLTGIHTGSYGKDIDLSFNYLLKKILEINDLKRLRISSIEITEIDDELIDILKNNKVLVNHMHIPLQSAADNILLKMNRKYKQADYYKIIQKIRKVRPDMLFTTDVIVGFPTESDADFEETVDFIKKVNFFFVHIFPFSKREKTKAATMPEQITGEVIKKRVKVLGEIVDDLRQNHLELYKNKIVEVLFEQKKNNYYLGHTESYVIVKVKSDNNLLNQVKNVKIHEIKDQYCIGQIMKG